MFGLKVAAALVPVFLLQALPSMAASLQVPRGEAGGIIHALLRHPIGSRSVLVGRDIYIRQGTCPAGTYACEDGIDCCATGTDCVVVDELPACCAPGSPCGGGDPVCPDPTWALCPGGAFCCPSGDQCLSDGTCDASGGGSSTDLGPSMYTSESTVVPSTSSVLAPPTPSVSQKTATSTSVVPKPTMSSTRTTSTDVGPSTSSGPTTTPDSSTNGATLTASHSVVVCAAFVVALLPFLN